MTIINRIRIKWAIRYGTARQLRLALVAAGMIGGGHG